MAVGADPTLAAAEPRIEGTSAREGFAFWNLRSCLALEVALLVVFTLTAGVGTGIVAAVAGLFPSAYITAFSLARTDSPLGNAIRRLARKKIAVVAILFITLFYVCGVLAPVLPIPSYTDQDLTKALQGPSIEHPFGTDRLGRDQLSRVIWSSQTTVIVTVATMVTGGLVLSVGLGLASGYLGGWVDAAIMRVGDVFAGLPTLLMLILINATLKDQVKATARDVEDFTGIGGLANSGAADYLLVFGALSLFTWVGGARIIRAQVLALRETEFVLAARSLGASARHIMVRHLLPNVSNIIIVGLSISLAGSAGSEIALSWFGIGIQAPRPSFGALIQDGAASVRTVNEEPHLIIFPAIVVGGLLYAFNLLGDALTDVFTPKAR